MIICKSVEGGVNEDVDYRSGLKIPYPTGRAGSTSALGTNSTFYLMTLYFGFGL